MKELLTYLVHRRRVAGIITISVLLVGVFALFNIRREATPQFNLSTAKITTARPGKSPAEIERSITAPLEEELLRVAGVDELTSTSMEGLSSISVRIDPTLSETGYREVVNNLSRALARARGRLPGDIPEDPELVELSSEEFPLVELNVTGSVPEATLRDVARNVEAGIRELNGIGRTRLVGNRRREIRIMLDPNRAGALGISAAEIAQALHVRDVGDTSGAVRLGASEGSVVVLETLESPSDVGAVVVRRGSEPGNVVRIHDVGDVVLDFEEWEEQQRVDGALAVGVRIYKSRDADGIEVTDRIRDYVDEQRRLLPASVELLLVNDTGRLTEQLLDTLLNDAAMGLVLLLLALRVFFDWRLAFWIGMGIPVAMAFALATMHLFGVTINLLSLIGMVLVMGIMVDDSVVTGESIYARRAAGADDKVASIEGTLAVAPPVLACSITTVVAFAPVAFIGGMDGQFLRPLPIVIGLCLLGSLLESKLLLPAHLVGGAEGKPLLQFERSRVRYEAWLRRRIASPGRTVVGFVTAASAVAVLSWSVLRFNLYPELEIDTFNVKVELPADTPLERTVEKTAEVEALIRDVVPAADRLHIVTQIGHHDTDPYGASEGRSTAWALVTTYMVPREQREVSSLQRIAELRERARELKGFELLVVEPLQDSPKRGKPVEVDVIGDASESHVVKSLQSWLRQHPGVTDSYTSQRKGKDHIRVEPDMDRLAAYGLSVEDLAIAVRLAHAGLGVATIRTPRERMDLRLALTEEVRGSVRTLEELLIPPAGGGPAVPLRSVARLVSESGESAIRRRMGFRTTTVYADLDRSITTPAAINAELRQYVESSRLLAGDVSTRLHFGGELVQQAETMGRFVWASLAAIVLIFIILAVLFETTLQSLLVLSVLPFGLVGVMAGFALQGIELSLIALIGVTGLIGVLVNDSTVMVAHLNHLRREVGRSLLPNEVAAAASHRLQAILITTVTTVIGLVPAAYGLGGTNALVTPMIMAIAWGLLFGTTVTLVLVPALYALEASLGRWMAARKRPRPWLAPGTANVARRSTQVAKDGEAGAADSR